MDTREWFVTAADGFLELLPGLADHLEEPALGQWDVRSLLGHTCRAFTTVETYLGNGADSQEPVALATPAEYFRAAAEGLADPAEVTRRGIEAGRALGDAPLDAARDTAHRVVSLVHGTSDDAGVASPLGMMRLADYLPTRAFELTVHGLDLARATAQAPPLLLRSCLRPSLELCLDMASTEQHLSLLSAVTGREALDADFSVL